MFKKYSKISLVIVSVLFVASSVLFFVQNPSPKNLNQEFNSESQALSFENKEEKVLENTKEEVGTEVNQAKEISVTLIVGDKNLQIKTKENTSFYDALVELQKKNLITFSGIFYPALGFFVTDIDELHSNNDQNLMYTVNGIEASVGVSAYQLQEGDVLQWELK